MKSFKEFYLNRYPVLDEQFHYVLNGILNDPNAKIEDLYDKFRDAARHLERQGVPTGLAGDISNPDSGSSRVVFHHSEPHKIRLDGKITHTPVVSKIAYPGELDEPGIRHPNDPHLGPLQNQNEAHKMLEPHYTMVPVRNSDGSHRTDADGTKHYTTNPNGVIPTIFESHPKGHHLLVQKANLYGAEHPRGDSEADFLKHHGTSDYHIQEALRYHWDRARGKTNLSEPSHLKKTEQHPLFQKLLPIVSYGVHPVDLSVEANNLGYVIHPHTGKHTAVALDVGLMQPTVAAIAEGHIEPHNTVGHYRSRWARVRAREAGIY